MAGNGLSNQLPIACDAFHRCLRQADKSLCMRCLLILAYHSIFSGKIRCSAGKQAAEALACD